MKKLALFIFISTAFCYSSFSFSENCYWSGLYLGSHAGYWGSQSNKFSNTGSVIYINPTFESGASNIANALAQIAAQDSSLNSYGFIGGARAGYNYEFSQRILLGIDMDFDGLTQSNNTTTSIKTVNLVDFDENYLGSLAVNERINYLGSLRARLGYLYHPTLLIYATGGFAYGNVRLNTTWSAQESLGPTVFPTVTSQNNFSKTIAGWTLGAGIEWLFKPHWSSMLEYSYYSLNNFNVANTLAQTNASLSPPALWGSANANTSLSLSIWTIRVGLNYHFL